MKRLLLGVLCLSFMCVTASAQKKGFMSNYPQEHFATVTYAFMSVDDDMGMLQDKYCMALRFSMDNYFNDSFFVGGGLGLSMPSVTSKIPIGDGQPYYSYTDLYNLEIPFYGGFNIGYNLFRLETGPVVGIALAGETEVMQAGKTISTTKLKDMKNVSTFYVSWMVNAYIFRFLKVGFAVALTDTPFGKDIGVSCLSVGLAF